MSLPPAGFVFPPELWTQPLDGTELIRIDVGSAYATSITTAQLASLILAYSGPFPGLPTSPAGLPPGALWRNGDFLCVV
ncbi:MAG TPA: hypothetical protein VNW90_10685 [Acetobacteraceae bacterium]|jgi:hypothetical protein|nr:hypothetical protein [Acetobacteraceae bacterium]